jgi:hypothetical protein
LPGWEIADYTCSPRPGAKAVTQDPGPKTEDCYYCKANVKNRLDEVAKAISAKKR